MVVSFYKIVNSYKVNIKKVMMMKIAKIKCPIMQNVIKIKEKMYKKTINFPFIKV
jgi:hypothetical protein